jgi:hypothetical protein
MSEKKVVRRNVAIALGIACIILIAGLGGVMAYYSMVVNDKNTTYGSYASSHAHTNSDYNSLQSTYDNYVSSHSHTDSEYNSLTVASLQNVGMSVSNTNKQWSWDPPSHLAITDFVFNMGTNTAYNCKFHVKVWSSENTLLKDTYTDLGSIAGRSYIYKSVAEVPYEGWGHHWSVTLEWT